MELISRKIIKPSSPTLDHLRHYQLSFTDQLCPPVYNSFVFFYPADDADHIKFNSLEVSDQLQQSLSNVLTHFYPLAGRLKDNIYVDCNDEGVPFLQVRVKYCKLAHVLENREPSELNKFLPFEFDGDHHEFLLGVQFNIFECGGIGIGLCISHKISDIFSFFVFFKSWAATFRGEPVLEPPQFESATLFPAGNLFGYDPRNPIFKTNIVAKRFVFSKSSIETLIAKYYKETDTEKLQRQSPTDVLSAFLWHQIVAATKVERKTDTVHELVHYMNLRPVMCPPQSEYSFGNISWAAKTVPSEDEGCNLVSQIRESINKVDSEYVKTLQEGGMLGSVGEQIQRVARGEVVRFTFTSLCGLPIYEADFGWGKPVWAGSPRLTFKNQIVFTDTASGEGIEAKVQLTEEDMVKFQDTMELLESVTTDRPCILLSCSE
ncbi:hypothetical protein SADUNF_Sadunf10G0017000 [Salix dunnii]|uniref:Uncharacterized protein n=1 Tax=Salix dunnii TaxID=1413687 RepID=A0A835MR27_9ROSI|nr:hypothetical protein SADUNF_Sadunf10G0017000 [Salix dunnii]